MTSLPALAIVAGGGVFPAMIANAVSARGTKVFIVHLQNDSDHFGGYPSMSARPEQLSVIFAELKKQNISDLVLIGRMKRPGIASLRPDWFTIKLIPRICGRWHSAAMMRCCGPFARCWKSRDSHCTPPMNSSRT